MDFFTKEKMLFWCVVVLMLLNAAMLTFFWLGRPPMDHEGGPGGGRRIMEEQLHLSADQARQFDQIRNRHFLQTDPLQQEMHEIRMALLDEIFAVEPNETTIQVLTARIGQGQSQFERLLFDHFRELKEACSDRQMPELRRMLAGIIENTRPRDPRERPPGHERGLGPPPPR